MIIKQKAKRQFFFTDKDNNIVQSYCAKKNTLWDLNTTPKTVITFMLRIQHSRCCVFIDLALPLHI